MTGLLVFLGIASAHPRTDVLPQPIIVRKTVCSRAVLRLFYYKDV